MKVLVACESNKSSSCFHYLCLLMGILGRQVSFVEFKEINYRCFWYLVFWAFVLIFLFHVLEDGVSSLKFFFFPPNKGKKKGTKHTDTVFGDLFSPYGLILFYPPYSLLYSSFIKEKYMISVIWIDLL